MSRAAGKGTHVWVLRRHPVGHLTLHSSLAKAKRAATDARGVTWVETTAGVFGQHTGTHGWPISINREVVS